MSQPDRQANMDTLKRFSILALKIVCFGLLLIVASAFSDDLAKWWPVAAFVFLVWHIDRRFDRLEEHARELHQEIRDIRQPSDY